MISIDLILAVNLIKKSINYKMNRREEGHTDNTYPALYGGQYQQRANSSSDFRDNTRGSDPNNEVILAGGPNYSKAHLNN